MPEQEEKREAGCEVPEPSLETLLIAVYGVVVAEQILAHKRLADTEEA